MKPGAVLTLYGLVRLTMAGIAFVDGAMTLALRHQRAVTLGVWSVVDRAGQRDAKMHADSGSIGFAQTTGEWVEALYDAGGQSLLDELGKAVLDYARLPKAASAGWSLPPGLRLPR